MTSVTINKTHRDLEDAAESLRTYWSRGPADLDYRVADLHMAAEALMRAVASLTLTVERMEAAR